MIKLNEFYKKTLISFLMEELKYSNIHKVPKLQAVIINMGLGIDAQNRTYLKNAIEELRLISGQHPIITKTKKSITLFKIRKDIPIGLKVTLRRKKMYNFIEKLIHLIFPRIPDFKGLNNLSFDSNGNYNFGISDQLIFPEIDYEKVDKLVENCKELYPDLPDYVLWVLACDYYIHEEKDDEDDDNEAKREQLKRSFRII